MPAAVVESAVSQLLSLPLSQVDVQVSGSVAHARSIGDLLNLSVSVSIPDDENTPTTFSRIQSAPFVANLTEVLQSSIPDLAKVTVLSAVIEPNNHNHQDHPDRIEPKASRASM